jgi:ankyrin repeat protein
MWDQGGLRRPADLEFTARYGFRTLHSSVGEGQTEAVKFLVETCGANTEVTDNIGRRPLHFAADRDLGAKGAVLVEVLAANGANLEARDYLGDTALHVAVRKGNSEVVRALLEAGADVVATNDKGITSLQMAGDGEMSGLVEEWLATKGSRIKSAHKTA